jgi:hypothetical protein
MPATRIDRGSTETTAIYQEGTDLVFERTFDAPRDRVWKAFTDPTMIPRWWGPHGTTATAVIDPQRYTCLEPRRRYRYAALDIDFVREIAVDADGLVVTYPGLFRRLP